MNAELVQLNDAHIDTQSRFINIYHWLTNHGRPDLAESMTADGITSYSDAVKWFTNTYITNQPVSAEKVALIQEQIQIAGPQDLYYGKPDTNTGYVPQDLIPVQFGDLQSIIDTTIEKY